MPYATRLSTAFLSHVENKNEEADKELRHLHCLSPGISWSINWTATAFHIFFVVQGGGGFRGGGWGFKVLVTS